MALNGMIKNISEGDIVVFSRYGRSLTGTVTAVNMKAGSIAVDKIHYVKMFQIIKHMKKQDKNL